MPRKARLDARGLRSRAYWPSLPEHTQLDLLTYLSWYRAVAELGQQRCQELAAISGEPGIMTANADYWATVIKGIDWLIYHLPHRQEYLEWQQAKQEGRLVEADPRPERSSSPVAPGSSSAPTDPAAAGGPAGRTRSPRSGKPSRKRGPTA